MDEYDFIQETLLTGIDISHREASNKSLLKPPLHHDDSVVSLFFRFKITEKTNNDAVLY